MNTTNAMNKTKAHPREVSRYGDAAVIATAESAIDAHGLAASVRAASLAGVCDVVVGERSVTILADISKCDFDELAEQIARLEPASYSRLQTRTVEIPVIFDGQDLDEVAGIARCGPRDVVEALTGARFEVAFLGFAPGFAYMTGLPPMLAAIERRSTPRPSVTAGSVAIAGGFASVYPTHSPGGWQVVGSTDMALFDPLTPPFAKLAPGDRVRFVPAPAGGADARSGSEPPRVTLSSSSLRTVSVERPGLLSLVQDAGRPAVASIGVPHAGASDPLSLRLANRLVGNPDDAAVIEVTGTGPHIRVGPGTELHLAVVGSCTPRIDDRPFPPNTVAPMGPGQLLTTGEIREGLRIYVAFDGGIETPALLGSRSSDVLCGLGPGPLRVGDVLGLGGSRLSHGRLLRTPSSLRPEIIRVIAGPDPFSEEQVRVLTLTNWRVAADSDRIGVRLLGPEGERIVAPSAGIASRATVTGAIQVPTDGRPIALGCDHATVGGYPVIATIVRADLGRLGQLRPGGQVRFELVDIPGARAALAELERELDRQVAGWFPVRAD